MQVNSTDRKNRNVGILGALGAKYVAKVPFEVANICIHNQLLKKSQTSKQESQQLQKVADMALEDIGLANKGVRIYRLKQLRCEDRIGFKGYFMNKVSPKSILKKLSPANLVEKPKLSTQDEKPYEILQEAHKKVPLYEFLLKSKSKKTRELGERKVNNSVNSLIKTLKDGKNSFFLFNTNTIMTPEKSLQPSIFHEMGHAMNCNDTGLFKTLQQMRFYCASLTISFLMIALLNKRKVTDIKSDKDSSKKDYKLVKRKEREVPYLAITPGAGFVQKKYDFIKRNIGKLCFLAMIPTVLEEGIASLRGQKIAKKYVDSRILSKDLFNQIKSTNAVAFCTYLLGAISTALIAKFTVDVKDKIQDKYEKNMLKSQQKQACCIKLFKSKNEKIFENFN